MKKKPHKMNENYHETKFKRVRFDISIALAENKSVDERTTCVVCVCVCNTDGAVAHGANLTNNITSTKYHREDE